MKLDEHPSPGQRSPRPSVRTLRRARSAHGTATRARRMQDIESDTGYDTRRRVLDGVFAGVSQTAVYDTCRSATPASRRQMAPSRGTCSATRCRPRASTPATSTTTSLSASATTARDSAVCKRAMEQHDTIQQRPGPGRPQQRQPPYREDVIVGWAGQERHVPIVERSRPSESH